MSPEYLSKNRIRQFIKLALAEDHGDGDHSSIGSIPESSTKQAQLIIKDDGILAGVEMARHIFSFVDSDIQVHVRLEDGTAVELSLIHI